MQMKHASFFVLVVAMAFSAQEVFAWGFKGHQSVNRVAISMVANPGVKRFLEGNKDQIIQFANTPDTRWKGGSSREQERPMHWFEMDAYGDNRLGVGLTDLTFAKAERELGQDYVNEYGLAMWRISDFYVQLTKALKIKDYQRAVQIAGVMGHYVGDMTQPMHATSDYDGQSINKPGVHKYYETTLVDQIDPSHLFDSIQKIAGEHRSGLERHVSNELSEAELQKLAWQQAKESFEAVEAVYQRFDKDSPEDAWLKDDLMPRIGRAAAFLGKIWDAAFTAAGEQDLPYGHVDAPEPEWIPLKRR
jgi:hypothetical protein